MGSNQTSAQYERETWGSKNKILRVFVNCTNYAEVTRKICEAARARHGGAVAAVDIHGIMLGTYRPSFGKMLNELEMATPDGQGVRWALNLLYHAKLRERVYGPELTVRIAEQAARNGLRIYLYGSTPAVISDLKEVLLERYPKLQIAGVHCPPFRPLTPKEIEEDIKEIRRSGAHIVLVGLGCPKQEIWVWKHRTDLTAVLIAVGAAFDFLSGHKPQAPRWVQRYGLEMVFRVLTEPRRLWKRFAICHPPFLFLVLLQGVFRLLSVPFRPHFPVER